MGTAAPSQVRAGDQRRRVLHELRRAASRSGVRTETSRRHHRGHASTAEAVAEAQAVDAKYSRATRWPRRASPQLEAESVDTGKSPGQLKREWHSDTGKDKNKNKKPDYKQADETQEAKLLTILVEFSENANDDFTGVQVPTEFGSTECKPGEVQNGPLHNNIPNPADYELEDNNSMWVSDFSSEHYNTMLFTDKGITERVRRTCAVPTASAASTSRATR